MIVETDRLIENLTTDLEPVKRLPSPWKRSLVYAASALLCIGAGVSLAGIRPDMAAIVTDMRFLFESFLALAVAVVAIAGAFLLSVPGHQLNRWSAAVIATPVVVWLAQLGARYLTDTPANPYGLSLGGSMCTSYMVLLGVAPGLILFVMIRKGAPLHLGWAGALAGVAITALAALGMQFVCQMSANPLHALVWHVSPIMAAGIGGVLLGRMVFRW